MPVPSNDGNIFKALDRAYMQAMERILAQWPEHRDLAIQTLSWICCAKRRLTSLELQHAIAVEINQSKLDSENITSIELIASVCAGLIRVDEESGTIGLVHYTAQEYFERNWKTWLPNAHTDLTKACLSYLSFEAFKTGSCPTQYHFERRLKSHPFYSYAASNWGYHARESSVEGGDMILNLLENPSKVSACSQAMRTWRDWLPARVETGMTGLHLAAYFGLWKSTSALLERFRQVNAEDRYGRTPLSLAAENGHEAVVKLLLENNANIESQSIKYGLVPLSWAAKNGHKAVVKLLLENNADIEAKDFEYGLTPLLWAAKNGYEEVVKLLLDKNADIESEDLKYGLTPLSWAAENGHEAVVKLLLKSNANIESRDHEYGQTPLLWAAENGHEAVVELLLERSANTESKDHEYSQTPLLWAAKNGHEAVVKLLLGNNADVESKDYDYGQTPLSWAARDGHEAVVKLLLQRNAHIESKDHKYGQTPLSWAAKNGHEAVVKLLLESNANIESKDEDGQTPLSQAAENGHEAVVKLLHESNADIEPKRSFTGQVDQRLTGRCLLLNHEKVRLESKEQSYAGCSTQQNHLNHHVRSHKEKPQVCWVPGCHRAFLRTDNLNAHYVKHHSKRGGRNHYVSTLDENSREFNPDFRGPLRPDGHPFHWSKLVDPDTSSSQDLERFPMYDEWE
jgi:ankyrin repeat protein